MQPKGAIKQFGTVGFLAKPDHTRRTKPCSPVFRVVLGALDMGPCWTMVAFFLWASIWYMIQGWYVLGSMLEAHGMDCRCVACCQHLGIKTRASGSCLIYMG